MLLMQLSDGGVPGRITNIKAMAVKRKQVILDLLSLIMNDFYRAANSVSMFTKWKA